MVVEIEWLVKRIRAKGGCVGGVVGPGRANCRLDSQIAQQGDQNNRRKRRYNILSINMYMKSDDFSSVGENRCNSY